MAEPPDPLDAFLYWYEVVYQPLPPPLAVSLLASHLDQDQANAIREWVRSMIRDAFMAGFAIRPAD